MTLEAQFAAITEANLDLSQGDKIAIAVSGGSDSTALMHLAARCLPKNQISIVTVDHGLRDCAVEIELVAKQARALGLSHKVLNWHWGKTGNLQAAARQGRYQVIEDWAEREGIDTVMVGHTRDDQAETILMRLARGSGVDGLAGMSLSSLRDGWPILRPLLGISRVDLRAWLVENGISWSEDPSNEDNRFDRVKAREMMPLLAELGLTNERLLQTAAHMKDAKTSLHTAALSDLKTRAELQGGDLILQRAYFRSSGDTVNRALAEVLRWIGGHNYRPRFQSLLHVKDQILRGEKATLMGCVIAPETETKVRFYREAAAVGLDVDLSGISERAISVVWDRRWTIEQMGTRSDPMPKLPRDLTIGALRDTGLRACPNWRETGLPRASLLATPAIWRGDELVAAPLAGFPNGWHAQVNAEFLSMSFSH